MFNLQNILMIVELVVLVAFSAIVHECAHGWMAYKLGDPTAKEMGRLTLNPMAHIDPFGSLLLPLLMALVGGPMFAFAKPVPFNPRRLRNPERDEALVAIAGPVSNVLQAILGTIVLWLVVTVSDTMILNGIDVYDASNVIVQVLVNYIYINLTLAFFNLIPIPPLDGSKLISPLLRGESRKIYNYLQLYGMPILLLIVYVLPRFIGIDLIGIYLDFTVGNIFNLLLFWT